jgi:hypothetical protein
MTSPALVTAPPVSVGTGSISFLSFGNLSIQSVRQLQASAWYPVYLPCMTMWKRVTGIYTIEIPDNDVWNYRVVALAL